MTETLFTNARIVLPDEVVEGTVVVRGRQDLRGRSPTVWPHRPRTSRVTISFPASSSSTPIISRAITMPRPGVAWPAIPAVMAHDAQIAAAGITTVFDALRAGTFEPGDLSAHQARSLCAAPSSRRRTAGRLRAQHFIHLRCELPCADTAESAEIDGRGRPPAPDLHHGPHAGCAAVRVDRQVPRILHRQEAHAAGADG